MKRVGQFLPWLALLGAGLRADTTLPVPTESGSGITIKLSSPVTSVPRFGFVPVRVAIDNSSGSDGVWKFRFTAGAPGAVLGLAVSSFELAVPATQSRETWFFVPLAEPGISPNVSSAMLAPVSPSAAFSTPPAIDGVYPTSPPGVSRPVVTRQATSVGTNGAIMRTFTISQTGPAALLPPLPAAKLPANAAITITPPNAAGDVTRTTTVAVYMSPGTLGTRSSSASPSAVQSSSALSNARAKLSAASLDAFSSAGVTTRSSTRTNSGSGMLEITVTLQQTGPASELPLPDLKKLPAGFTSVTVNPTANANEVVREFVYVEKSVMAAPPPTSSGSGGWSLGGAVGGGGGSMTFSSSFPSAGSAFMTASQAEAEARRVLTPTGLLTIPGSVRSLMLTRAFPISAMLTGGGSGYSSNANAALTIFEQTGPTSDLRLPPASSLPPTVRVSLHPTATPGTSVRVIAVVDPAVLVALKAAVITNSGPSSIDKQSLTRLELTWLGYLRNEPKISQSFSSRGISGGSSAGGAGPEVYIFTESGPAALLPDAPAGTLPPGITCRITPGLIGGEVARNFIVDPAVLAGAPAPAATGARAAVTTVTMPRPFAPGVTGPSALSIDIAGPGVTQGHVVFPNAAPSPLPPMAIGGGLEATLRAKLAAASLRALPNFASVDPALLPPDWRVWSSFNSVLLKADDFFALDAGRRAALRSWVALGGVLYLTPTLSGEAWVEHIGAGRIDTLDTPIADQAPRDATTSLQLATLSPGMPNRDILRFAPGLPMAELLKFEGVDVLWLTIFLILFAVLVGPVNLFFFAPAGKRHRLFFTTPLISVLGALAVAGAIIFQDGFGGDGVRRALVMFLPGENQAAIFQEQATRTGFLAKTEFALDDAVLCAALPTDEMAYMNLNPATQFTRAGGQASGEWFRNRSRQAQMLRQLVPTRARVEIVERGAGGEPIVESTVATELRGFRLRDDNGSFWTAESVRPGRRVSLRKETVQAGDDVTVRELTGDGTTGLVTVLAAANPRSSWQWMAQGDNTDIAPIKTLAAIRWKEHPVTYTGIAERDSAAPRPKAASSPPPAAGAEKGGQ